MKPTTFRKDGEDFLALWEPAGIGIGFSRIRETDSGMLYAELDVQSIRPEATGTLLSPTRFNMMAATERERLAGVLTKRAADVDWHDALESAIGRVVREWRTPEPLVDLWDVEDPGDVGYLFRPLLVSGETNIWFADEQSLKSYLALVLGVATVSGVAVPGIGSASIRGPVVYYDWETQGSTQRRRLTRVCRGLGLDLIRDVHYRRMARPLVDCVAAVRAEVSRLGAVLVIFDSLGWLCNGDLNKTEVALPAMNAIGSVLGPTRLVLAHHGKAGREGEPTVYGSGFFEFSSRNRWLIKKSQDEGANRIALGLYHKKGSDDERHPTFGLAFTFDREADTVSVGAADVRDDPELLRNASPPTKILAALRDAELCKATVDRIARDTGIPAGSVKRHLLKMDGRTVTNLNPTVGGRGNAAVWALLAPDENRSTVHPLNKESTNGFSPLRGETVEPKPFETVQANGLDEEVEELPF